MDSYGTNTLLLLFFQLYTIAIATAAIEMLGGDTAAKMSRKPEIMADAAYLILTQDSRSFTGKFLIDDEVLKEHGVTDMDQYANAPGNILHGYLVQWMINKCSFKDLSVIFIVVYIS